MHQSTMHASTNHEEKIIGKKNDVFMNIALQTNILNTSSILK